MVCVVGKSATALWGWRKDPHNIKDNSDNDDFDKSNNNNDNNNSDSYSNNNNN